MNSTLVQQLTAVANGRGIDIDVTERNIRVSHETDSYLKWHAQTGRVDDEFLTDLIAYFKNAEEPMNIYSTDLFTYLAGDMIGQATIALTISGVTLESMNSGKGGAQTKPCLHFKERNKLMVLNKTNAKTIAAILGPETENWVGARVIIGTAMVDAFGKTTRSLRIVDVQPEKIVGAKPRTANAQQGDDNGQQDDLFGDGDPAAKQAALATAQGQLD